jgi:hypothetical protein
MPGAGVVIFAIGLAKEEKMIHQIIHLRVLTWVAQKLNERTTRGVWKGISSHG